MVKPNTGENADRTYKKCAQCGGHTVKKAKDLPAVVEILHYLGQKVSSDR